MKKTILTFALFILFDAMNIQTTEGYRFSNDFNGSFGLLGLKDTSIQMNKSETNLTIQLNYREKQ